MAEPHRFGEAMNYAFVSDVSCRLSIYLTTASTQGLCYRGIRPHWNCGLPNVWKRRL